MNSTVPRDLTFHEIRDRLDGPREVIWNWLRVNGPATTTAIAEAAGIGLLTVRPRVSELVAWGFAECVGRHQREGVYRHISIADAQTLFERAQNPQLKLNL